MLLTALLVLAIGASSALVFTNQVQLLKLAVILALWAAVVAAFVSVIYRRQSDVDHARARDLKLVYDLQLDREISARREYELTVESQLRRELASELRAHSSDEVSALRAELAALRTNLEILFDAELSERPALETERKAVRGYSEWDREHESARERVNRVASVRAEEPSRRADDSTIIDVPEEPLVPPPRQPAAETYQPAYAYPPADVYAAPRPTRAPEAREAPEADRSAHWRLSDQDAQAANDAATPPGWVPPAPAPPPPEPPPQQQRPAWPPPAEAPRPPEQPAWQPVASEGQWLPAGTTGSRWNSDQNDSAGAVSWAYDNAPPRDQTSHRSPGADEPAPAAGPPVERRGRHSSVAESAASRVDQPEADWGEPGRRARARHSAEYPDSGIGGSAAPAMSPPPSPTPPPTPPSPPPPSDRGPVMSPPAPPSARHRSTDQLSEADEPQSGGQSVAELLARLQTSPSEGGRRRRRED